MPSYRVKELKDITLEYHATGGTATFKVYSDLPGGAMALRTLPAGGTMAITTTPASLTLPADGLEGNLFQFEAVPGALCQLRLFGGVVRWRPIGTFLDGSKGEIWKTREMSFGI